MRRRGRAGLVVALALTMAMITGCGGDDDMDLAEQKDLLEQGLAAAATVLDASAPGLEAAPCDEPLRDGRQKWQGSSTVDVPSAGLDDRLDQVRQRWDELGIDADLSVLDDGSEPGLFGRRGDVGISAVSRPARGDTTPVTLAGSTGCGERP